MGRFTITYRSNDWGQHDEQWAMQCSRCKTTHGIYRHGYTDRKGIHAVDFLWAPKQHLRELADLEKTIRNQKDELATYLAKQYGARWLKHFEGASKKTTWAELTADDRNYPQLSTFYGHVRSDGLEHVLKGYLQYDKVETVTRILHPEDAELAARVRQIRDLKSELDTNNDQIRKTGFR
jgi:hypothetical protein